MTILLEGLSPRTGSTASFHHCLPSSSLPYSLFLLTEMFSCRGVHPFVVWANDYLPPSFRPVPPALKPVRCRGNLNYSGRSRPCLFLIENPVSSPICLPGVLLRKYSLLLFLRFPQAVPHPIYLFQ